MWKANLGFTSLLTTTLIYTIQDMIRSFKLEELKGALTHRRTRLKSLDDTLSRWNWLFKIVIAGDSKDLYGTIARVNITS